MTTKEKLQELLIILKNLCKDGIVSPKETSNLQDWVDENSVCFDNEGYAKVIDPLQRFLDNGELCDKEQIEIISIVEKMIKK